MIVGCIIVLKEPLSLFSISQLLQINSEDVVHAVRSLRTLLITGVEDVTGESIPRLHKSFFEFITPFRTVDTFAV